MYIFINIFLKLFVFTPSLNLCTVLYIHILVLWWLDFLSSCSVLSVQGTAYFTWCRQWNLQQETNCSNCWSQFLAYSTKVKKRMMHKNNSSHEDCKVESARQDFFLIDFLSLFSPFITKLLTTTSFFNVIFSSHLSVNISISCVVRVLWSFRWTTVISFMPTSVMEDSWLRTVSKSVLYSGGPCNREP